MGGFPFLCWPTSFAPTLEPKTKVLLLFPACVSFDFFLLPVLASQLWVFLRAIGCAVGSRSGGLGMMVFSLGWGG